MSDLKDFIIKDGVLEKYKRKTGDVVIPDTVSEISAWAFDECEKISSIKIPDSVTTICDGAFKNCKGLADENGFIIVRDVLHGYFGGPIVNIPNGVKRISSDAFMYCKTITAITFPETVTEIGSGTFSDCIGLVDDNGFLTVKNTLYGYYGEDTTVNIPDDTTQVDAMAFLGNNYITNVILPKGLKCIGRYAFSGCKNLTQIIIPSSVSEFGEDLFAGSDKLNNIITSDEVLEKVWEQLGTKQKNNIILSSAKYGTESDFLKGKIKANKKKLLDIAISEDNVNLLSNTFAVFSKIPLDEIESYIEKAVSATQVTAFLLEYKNKSYSIAKQEDYEIDKTEKALGLKELSPAEWKKIFSYKKTNKGIIITGYKGKEIEVFIPAKIGTENVIEIGEGAFSPYVEKLATEVAKNRMAIQSVCVSSGTKKIGKQAFYGCKNLENIQIADSVTSIGEEAFRYCRSLVKVSLPKKIKAINRVTFADCCSLLEIEIPNSVKSIGNFAFNSCKKLEKIILPGSLEKINKDPSYSNRYAFADCPNLTIHAPAGSYAEQYAKENNIPFVAE